MNAVAIISQEQIEALVRDVQFIKSHIENQKPGGLYEDLITEEQLRAKLGDPSQATMWRNEKLGRFGKPIKVGNSKMYRLSEVLAMNTKRRK